MRRAAIFLWLAASASRAIAQESDDAPTGRERSPEELVTSVDIKSTRVAARFAERQRAWLERVAGAPFRARAKGQPWEKEAVAFVADGLAAWEPRSIYELDEQLATRGRQLREGGCDDPLVVGLAARFHYRGTYDHFFHWHGIADSSGELSADVFSAIAGAEAMLAGLEKLDAPRGFLRLIAAETAALCDGYDRGRGGRIVDRGRGWLRKALTDGSYRLPEEEELLVAHVLGEPMKGRAYSVAPEWRDDLEAAPLSPWARLALRPTCDWAESVRLREAGKRAESDELFRTLREEWAKAWKLHPEAPEPPSLVFDQMWSSRTVGGADAMEWLSRVLAARFDYEPAYGDMLSRLRPDFLGSVEELTAFGRVCAETRRFDTSVPLILPRALRTACMTRDWRPICRDPRTGRALVALGQGMLAEPARASQTHLWKSLAAVWALLGGEDRAALETLTALGEQPLHPGALHEMRWFHTSLDELRGDLALRLSPAREDDERGQARFREGEIEEACAAFRRALARAPADTRAQALIKQRLAIAEFEHALPRGEWMEVPTDLNLWQVFSGNWSNDESGALVLNGDDRPAHIRFRAHPGVALEWRGEFTFSAPPEGRFDPELGLAFRCIRGRHFLQMATWETGTTNLGIAFRQSFWAPNIGKKLPFCPPEMTVPLLEPNSFHITADALEMSLEVNDRKIFEHVKNTYYTEYADECQIGFAAKAQAPRNRTIIRNLQLRRLPSPVAKPAPKPPRAPIERPRVSPIVFR